VLEKKVAIKKEIAQMVAIDDKKNIVLYPPVEMVFDPYLNLLDYQICPAVLSEKILWKIEAISIATAKNFNSAGLFAVELLVNEQDEVLVNETAPRVHNSGHHTIEAHYCSQFDMLLRILLHYPLGNASAMQQTIMMNLIGAEGHTGTVHYHGLEEALAIENCFVHIYGKTHTKPGRKMGHITIATNDKQDLHFQANKVKNLLKVISK
jgi:5-(carboxyamino)imidazole ribonucleotide synthase